MDKTFPDIKFLIMLWSVRPLWQPCLFFRIKLLKRYIVKRKMLVKVNIARIMP